MTWNPRVKEENRSDGSWRGIDEGEHKISRGGMIIRGNRDMY